MALPTPPPTEPGDAPTIVFFLFETWFGQALVTAAALGLIGSIFRRWTRAHLQRLWGWLKDLRLTRKSTVTKEIASAVAEARSSIQKQMDEQAEEARVHHARQLAALLPPKPAELPEEERAILRDKRRHEGQMKDQWSISTSRSRERRYVLRNINAGAARNVRLVPTFAGSFEVISGPPWDLLENGNWVPFDGRIADPRMFSLMDRGIRVAWTDDHGDEQEKTIVVDRNYSVGS